uniref:RNA polymerase II-associated protein 3 n=1 Tax=Timspurckia oligopyrenoides TaxID=708627 RepID=A0A7S0ZGN3_9RHOD|mmetsp:Transcript_454/g.818  ORF Transcript_454/g.818 Transcript_454/m.818 type:complete len:362 (+) Transcript_454:28-1113(+)
MGGREDELYLESLKSVGSSKQLSGSSRVDFGIVKDEENEKRAKSKLEFVSDLKRGVFVDRGNDAFKRRDWKLALDLYSREFLSDSVFGDADIEMQLVDLRARSNAAQCSIKLKEYENAERLARIALERIKKYCSPDTTTDAFLIKLYYRRAFALVELGQLELAMTLIEQILKVDQKNEDAKSLYKRATEILRQSERNIPLQGAENINSVQVASVENEVRKYSKPARNGTEFEMEWSRVCAISREARRDMMYNVYGIPGISLRNLLTETVMSSDLVMQLTETIADVTEKYPSCIEWALKAWLELSEAPRFAIILMFLEPAELISLKASLDCVSDKLLLDENVRERYDSIVAQFLIKRKQHQL